MLVAAARQCTLARSWLQRRQKLQQLKRVFIDFYLRARCARRRRRRANNTCGCGRKSIGVHGSA
eukprot:7841262-Alexandrium_andersonii.AAC.1